MEVDVAKIKDNQPTLFNETENRVYKEPALISACFLGIPCRWHGRRAKKRDKLIEKLKEKYVLIPVCPEQLGGTPTPRTSEYLKGTGTQVLDDGLRIIAPETGEDVTDYHIRGAEYVLEIALIRDFPALGQWTRLQRQEKQCRTPGDPEGNERTHYPNCTGKCASGVLQDSRRAEETGCEGRENVHPDDYKEPWD